MQVVPGLYIGDRAAGTNLAFLKRQGITHVLNTAEGPWEKVINTKYFSLSSYSSSGLSLLTRPTTLVAGSATKASV